jgi:antitoxin PrlF
MLGVKSNTVLTWVRYMKSITQKRKRKRMDKQTRHSSRLTSKFQATIPLKIRKHLHLKAKDEIVYELLSDGTVVVRKITPLDLKYLKSIESTLTEWDSEDDERAYKHLQNL